MKHSFQSIRLLTGLALATLFSHAHAVSCGDLLFSNTTLTSDLNCTSGYYALEIRNNNVTLDLNGYTLSGTSALAGVIVLGQNNVTIKNGVIKGFWAGVNTADSDNLNIFDNVFFDLGAGVIVSSGNNATVASNDFIFTTSHAVSIVNHVAGRTANGNQVLNNEFYETRVGVEICGSGADSNIIEDNFIWKSMDYGIHINHSHDNHIYGNAIRETGGTAIRLNNASHNQMYGNSLRIGNNGLSILAQAGGACTASSSVVSKLNEFRGNHSIGFNTGVILGLGTSGSMLVYDNKINSNKIYDDNIGLFFNSDAHNNDGTGNAYSGTATPVIDYGSGNTY